MLAPPDIGLYAAALTDCAPYVSHFSLPDHEKRTSRLVRFLATDDPPRRAALLEQFGITHVAFPGAARATPAQQFGVGTAFRRIGVVGTGARTVALFARLAPEVDPLGPP